MASHRCSISTGTRCSEAGWQLSVPPAGRHMSSDNWRAMYAEAMRARKLTPEVIQIVNAGIRAEVIAELEKLAQWVREGDYSKDDARDEIARVIENRIRELRG